MSQTSAAPGASFTDFEIEVRSGQVHARCSLVGEASALFQSPFDQKQQAALRAWLDRAASAKRGLGGAPLPSSLSLDDPQRIGSQLFTALFPTPIRDLYNKARVGSGLRLRLRLGEDVERLPWELLYDPNDDYLALVPNTSLVRYVDAPVPVRPLELKPGEPLRLLLVAGWPGDLNLDAEIKAVKKALANLESAGRIVVDVLERATLNRLLDRLNSSFHIVHYLGHGEAPSGGMSAQLLFHDESNGVAPVPIDGIWRTLRRNTNLRLLWLNSCSGAVGKEGTLTGPLASAAARFVAVGVPAVLANQLRISDRAALDLAREFYTRLAGGAPVDVALADARLRVSVTDLNSLEWATPVLYMRAPDGMLFSLPQAPATSPASQSSAAASDPGEADLLRGRLSMLKKRLYQRQLQQAQYGISADPSILIEIDDLSKEIRQIEAELGGPR